MDTRPDFATHILNHIEHGTPLHGKVPLHMAMAVPEHKEHFAKWIAVLDAHGWPNLCGSECFAQETKHNSTIPLLTSLFGYEKITNPLRKDGRWRTKSGVTRSIYKRASATPTDDEIIDFILNKK